MFSLFLNCQKEYSYAGFTQLPSPGKERFKKKSRKRTLCKCLVSVTFTYPLTLSTINGVELSTQSPPFLEGLLNKALFFPKNALFKCYSKYAYLYKRSTH